jgi:hypothetical protein
MIYNPGESRKTRQNTKMTCKLISLLERVLMHIKLSVLSKQLMFIKLVLLSGAKRTAGCCDYIATPRKSSISCDPESQFGG